MREWMAKIGQSKSVAVNFLGKVKTISQMIAVPLLLYHDRIGALDPQRVGTWLIYLAAILTLVLDGQLSAARPGAARARRPPPQY